MNLLLPYENKMHSIEREVFKQIKDLHTKNPETSLQDLMLMLRPKNMELLQKKQFGILDEIKTMADDLSPQSEKKIKKLIEDTKNIIVDQNDKDPFQRKPFLAQLHKITTTFTKDEISLGITQKAASLPTSQNDVSAFIVTYSGKTTKTGKDDLKIYTRRSSREIAKRLLSTAEISIEHIKSKFNKGQDVNSNFLLECTRCNNEKGNMSLFDQVTLHPEMVKNTETYMNNFINLINKRKIVGYESYPTAVAPTLKEESKNLINIDDLVDSKLKVRFNFNAQPLLEHFN